MEVLRLLARRQTDKEIAEALFLGPRTVQSHVAHILNKLGVANRREAADAGGRPWSPLSGVQAATVRITEMPTRLVIPEIRNRGGCATRAQSAF